ncbi:MAG: hypothetical protein K2Y39_02445 [Candidatus Obscuribacterales bacterium]|nr:hypothetical protein [Candidatus Obscuribacterales bacterium]
MPKRKIPTPADIEGKNPNDEKKDKVLDLLVAELTKRKKGDKGDKPIFSDHVEPAVRELVVAELEGQGWTVRVQKIYGGKLHWYIQPA